MKLNAQIKKYRMKKNLSQEELAEKVYVTRQTISSWENEKSYPDIHSLLLLSSLFDVSLDELIKGDIEEMKLIIDEQDVQEFNYYGKIFSIHFLIMILAVCCTVVLLAGSVCAHPAWNMVCDNNVLGDKSRKIKKEKRCADIQGNCCFYGRKETG